MKKEQNLQELQQQALNISVVNGSTLVKAECPHCHADGFQIEFKENYPDNWKEYRCKICNRRFKIK